MNDNNKKRKNKSYYVSSKKSKESYDLEAGLKGFLITCNRNEKRAVSEAYNLFNEYANSLYGPPHELINSEISNEDTEIEKDDIEKSIANDVAKFKSIPLQKKRFQNVDTNTTNCIFIRTNLDNPQELVEKIFQDSYTSHVSKSRFILRLLPVIGTCRAIEEKFRKLAEESFDSYFKINPTPKTYCTIYKIRCNNSMTKEMIFSVIGHNVNRIDSDIKVNFDDPDLVVSVDVLQKICCISFLKGYFKYSKYNLFEITNKKEDKIKLDNSLDTNETNNLPKNKEIINSIDSIDNKNEKFNLNLSNNNEFLTLDKQNEKLNLDIPLNSNEFKNISDVKN